MISDDSLLKILAQYNNSIGLFDLIKCVLAGESILVNASKEDIIVLEAIFNEINVFEARLN